MDNAVNNSLQMDDPAVSVLMSCYNADRYLHEAIESVRTQTFGDFELILIDDGSTDETWSIIESYCDKDERVVAIAKENTGLADSLNVGIASARGRWIARLDADDLCEPKRLAEQVSFLCEHQDVVLLGTGHVEIDEQGLFVKEHLYPSNHQKLVRNLERLCRFFAHSSAIYRADVVKQVGGYNCRFRRAEDKRLWLELSSRGKIACLRKPFVRVRKHSNQISLDNSGKRQLYDAIAATVCHFLKKHGYRDPSISANEDEWAYFLNWVESQVVESGTLERNEAWAEARAGYFAPGTRLTRMLRFTVRLVQSGVAGRVLLQKFFGSSLPERLAWKWIKHHRNHRVSGEYGATWY